MAAGALRGCVGTVSSDQWQIQVALGAQVVPSGGCQRAEFVPDAAPQPQFDVEPPVPVVADGRDSSEEDGA